MANHNARVNIVIMYKECLLNHVAGEGRGEVRDGCGYFEASAPIGTQGAMVCAACHCQPNFHRKIVAEIPQDNDDVPPFGPHQRRQARHSPSRGQESIAVTDQAPTSEITSGDSKPQHRGARGREEVKESRSPVRNKRLTGPQSERLKAIAKRNNWKMFYEYSNEEVTEICSEIGIERRCLKAWIAYHRNERAIKQEVSN